MGGFLRKTFGQLRQGEGPAAAAIAPVVSQTIATATAGSKPSITAGVKTGSLIAGSPNIHTSPQGVVDEELKIRKRKLGAGKTKTA